MQAIQKRGCTLRLLRDAPIPQVKGDHDVKIKVKFSGICGTDLHIISGEFNALDENILGHEISGEVVEVGSKVKALAPGDPVTVNPNYACGNCSACRDSHPNYCKPGGLRSTVGIFQQGGWADYVVLPEAQVFKVPKELSAQHAVLCEPVSCLLRGFDIIADRPTSSKVLILGAGIIGLLWANMLHLRGYRNVHISEVAAGRKALAEGNGMGNKVFTPDEIEERLRQWPEKELDPNWGYDLIIDCTGYPPAVERAFKWLRFGSVFVLFGCCPNDSSISVDPSSIMLKEIAIKGVLINPFTMQRAVVKVSDMSASGYLNFDKLGIRCYKLEQYEEALATLKRGEISKAVFEVA